MTAFIRTILAFAAGMACSIALTLTGTATAGDAPSNTPVHCIAHTNASGDTSIGHCHTIAPAGHRTWEQHRACKYEDGVNCYWNADSAGNKKGHSFFTVAMPGSAHMVCVIYVRKADHHWDYCS